MATGTGSQVLDDLAAALGCSVSTVDDDEDSLVSAPAAKPCPPSPGGVEATPGDEWFPETEKARKEAAVYLGLEDEAPRPLADRLRPKTLDEVVGQDHLLKGTGPIARMRAQGRLESAQLCQRQ